MTQKEPIWFSVLTNPASYPHDVDTVTVMQTHISWVFLAGNRVYKVKKPVDFGFLDFTTLEKRHHFCKEELRLNKRLCPDLYLSVLPITSDGDEIEINGNGTVIEWCLLMNRMPEEGIMTHLLEKDEVDIGEIDQIIDKLVPFYNEADGGPQISKYGDISVIKQNTEENFEQTASFVGDLLDQKTFDHICGYTRRFLKDNEGLFKTRIKEGRIRDCHGDLYSANICFDKKNDELYIFDCIEFNQRFRCGDIASDVAFLAMDLDYHGLPVLSAHLAEKFSQEMKDSDLLKLMDFYKCYRAYVRGKIGCFTWASDTIDEETRLKAKKQAEDYFRLALKYSGWQQKGILYVFFGLSGTGKSTLASRWSEKVGAPVYNSDMVRKEIIAGIKASERRHESFGKGIYGPEHTKRTYRSLARFAGQHLMRGESVVLDATYRDHEEREALLTLAKAAGAEIHFIYCRCPEEEIRKRLERRVRDNDAVSDAGWEIYLRQKETFAPPEKLPSGLWLSLSTDKDVEEIMEELASRF